MFIGSVYHSDCAGIIRTNPITSLPQISESRILGFAKYLSEDIGYRTVGTKEHALADKWMLEQAYDVKKECERVVNEQTDRKLECEVWRQEGNGSHRRAFSFYLLDMFLILFFLKDSI